jgi:hypothetical protein
MPEKIKKTIYCPENFPPFQRLFFTDDEGQLFVITYEKGKNLREFIYDIFNSEGTFVGRIGFDNYGHTSEQPGALPAVFKNSRLFYIG